MISETSILLAEIETAIKIKQNEIMHAERVMRALVEARRLLIQKDIKIEELKNELSSKYNKN